MNNSILTDTKELCLDFWNLGYNRSPHEYKTILDIAYMFGTCLGVETFLFLGEIYGLRFSLGFALFTTFLGSTLGLAINNIWSVSFC